MDKVEEINNAVVELWEEEFGNDKHERMPLIYPPLRKGGLLFVGLNPSFGGKFSFLKGKGTEFEEVLRDPKKFYAWKSPTFKPGIAQRVEEIAQEEYKYFEPHQKMAKHLYHDKMKWAHVDLFFYRQSKQSEFIDKVFVKDTPKIPNPFGKRQLELSKQLILDATPKAIVVVNKVAANVFKSEFQVTFDEESNCCVTRLNEEPVPTFFVYLSSRFVRADVRRKVEREIRRVLFHRTPSDESDG